MSGQIGSKSKEKLKKKSKQNFSARIPRDYAWKLLDKIVDDLQAYSEFFDNDFLAELEVFRTLVRERDIKNYISLFCNGVWSLPQINARRSGFPNAQLEVVCKRLLTCCAKFDFPNSPFNQFEKALDSFVKYERRCARTNKLTVFDEFMSESDDGTRTTYECRYLLPRLRSIKNFLQRVLGDGPDETALLDQLRHGPGATSDKRGNDSILIEKFVPPIGTTRQAAPAVISAIVGNHQWLESLCKDPDSKMLQLIISLDCWPPKTQEELVDRWFQYGVLKLVDMSRICFVPKNSETLRTTEPQATGLIFYQLAIDKQIRSKLLRIGVDLRTQEKNRELARRATKDGLVTIDLSGASDCISLALLKLFPPKWRRFVQLLRHSRGGIERIKRYVPFEKVSAMGNGFTFSLETVIFCSVIAAIVEEHGETFGDNLHSIAVYGDDIIVHEKFAHDVIALLYHIGFSVNKKKTFMFGPIRESCGHDFYEGFRIDRPTLSRNPREIWEVIRDYNLLFDWEQRTGIALKKTRDYLVSLIPVKKRVFGPDCDDEIGWLKTTDQSLIGPPAVFIDLYDRRYILRRNVVKHPTVMPGDIRRMRQELYAPILHFSSTGEKFDLIDRDKSRKLKRLVFTQFGSESYSDSEILFRKALRTTAWEFSCDSFLLYRDSEEYRKSLSKLPGRADDGFYFLKKQTVCRPAMTVVPVTMVQR